MIRSYTREHANASAGAAGSVGNPLHAALAKLGQRVAARQSEWRQAAEAAKAKRPPAPTVAECEPERAPAPAPAPARREPFVRVPNGLLGRVLDGGRASAYAAHLLAIKARHGAGWALQETHVACKYGIGRRGFRAGIARLREPSVGAMRPVGTGAIRRGQPTRRWAASAMAEILQPGARNWVPLPERLLAEPSFVVSMVLAVLLSPRPMQPAAAAARIGVTSRTTVRELTRAALATGAVVQTVGPRGAVMLGRPSAATRSRPTASARDPSRLAGARPLSGSPPAGARDLARNVLARNVPLYRQTADCTADARKTPPQPPRRWRGAGEPGEGESILEALRSERRPAHVAEDLLGWLVAEGLGWWHRGAVHDPLEASRILCAELSGATPRAIAEARRVLEMRAREWAADRGFEARLPPPGVIVYEVRQAERRLGAVSVEDHDEELD